MSAHAQIQAASASMMGLGGGATYTLIEAFPPLASWTSIGAAVRTTGVADPDGGTAAETVEDDDTGAYLGIRYITSASLASGVSYRVTHRVQKDAVTSRYPEFQHNRGSSFAHVQLDTQNGVSVVRVTSGFTDVSTSTEEDPDNSGWWLVQVFFTSNVAGVLQMTPLVAAGTAFGGATTAAATGAITYFPGTLDSAS